MVVRDKAYYDKLVKVAVEKYNAKLSKGMAKEFSKVREH